MADKELAEIKRIHSKMLLHMQDKVKIEGRTVTIAQEPPMMRQGPPTPLILYCFIVTDKTGQVPLPDEQFRASNYYGIIHLVKMLARIENLLKMCRWNDFLQGRIMDGVDNLLGFLDKNHNKYCEGGNEYMTADTDYHTRVFGKNDDVPGTSSTNNWITLSLSHSFLSLFCSISKIFIVDKRL
ncbi:hypothetical protein CAEBREN_22865 [Caenorhabditis brenneri]|uniref:MRG domain-containing protein n=1 Tax=Caenorhabditis brenneri TaxID=135651 RepID=G0NY94_CAEBE|nr:hypothetical protein CAEBREN_22865 [Caenorhabditis brenneri]